MSGISFASIIRAQSQNSEIKLKYTNMKKGIAILDTQLMFGQVVSYYINNMTSDVTVTSINNEATQLFSNLRSIKTDIVIMELNISDRDGLEIISDIKNDYPEIRIIVLSAYFQADLVKSAMKAGADAYLHKSNDIAEIENSINEVLSGKIYLGDKVRLTPKPNSIHKVKDLGKDSFILKRTLTKREKEVLSCMVGGSSTLETSAMLYISNATVMVHKKNIMRKLKVKSTTNMLKLAIEEKLV